MIRRVLKRLLRRAPAPAAKRPERPPPPRAPAAEPEEPEVELELEGPELRRWVDAGRDPLLLDVREAHELRSGFPQGALLIPMNQVPDRLADLPRDRAIVVVCAAGARSYGVAHYLREQGIPDAWSLAGGVGAWFAEGGAHELPPMQSPFGLLTPVRLRPEAAEARGLPAPPEGLKGSVQSITPSGDGARFALQVSLPEGGSVRVEDLREDELIAIARRPRT